MDNYVKKALALNIPPGSMGNLDVRHDDWCLSFRGKGLVRFECNCDPDVYWLPAETPEEFADTFVALNSRRGPVH